VRSWQFWVGVGVSIASLILAFRGVDIRGVANALQQAEYIWLVPSVALIVVSLGVRAVRWRILFHPVAGLRLAPLFNVINISFLVNNILPARAGDVLRAALISAREPVSASLALATVVVERILDGLTVILILIVLLPFFPVPEEVVRVGQVAGLILAGATVVLMVLATQRQRAVAWVEILLERLPYLSAKHWSDRVGRLIDGLQVLRSPGAMAQAVVWSAAIWLLSGVAYYFVFRAFQLQLSMLAGTFVLAVTTLVLILPATPGYVGVFDYAAVLALAVFGVDRNLALSTALVLHAVTYVTFSVMGLVSLLPESLSLSGLISPPAQPADQQANPPTN
jgi:uncharacterized protein (TIRG00374 family)